jgi:Holliday junction resolvase
VSASQRTKGHNFERQIAGMLRELFPEARRGFQSRGGTKEAPDVDGTPFYIECKKGKRTNIKAAYRQAETASLATHHANRRSIRAPVAITRDDGDTILVTMDFAEWKCLVRKAFNINTPVPFVNETFEPRDREDV